MNMDGSAEGDLSDPVFGDIVHGKDGRWVRKDNWYQNSHAAELWISRMKPFLSKRFKVECLCKCCNDVPNITRMH